MEKMLQSLLERMEALEKRVAELEAENDELYERLGDLEDNEIE